MGVVHHSNFVRYLELARVAWMDEYDVPYTHYVERGLHFAVTRVEVDYERALRFHEEVEITAWLDWVRYSSLCFAYQLSRDEEVVALASTEHAAVDAAGRARRVPRERRNALRALASREHPRPTA